MSRLDVNAIRHTAGSSDNISLTSTGRVGIGTASPQRELHVQGATNGTIRLQAANNATSQLLFSDSDAEIRGRVGYFHTDDALDFYSAGQEGMQLDSSANFRFNSGYGSVATAYGVRAWITFTAMQPLLGQVEKMGIWTQLLITALAIIR